MLGLIVEGLTPTHLLHCTFALTVGVIDVGMLTRRSDQCRSREGFVEGV